MQAALAEQSTQLASEILGLLNQAHDREDVILSSVPLLDDADQIVDIRLEAVSRKTWRVECACDATLIATVKAQIGTGGGVVKVLKEKAKKGQSDLSTIYRNAQVYTTFFSKKVGKRFLNVQNLLNEKGYYEAALRTDHPEKTIKLLANEKAANPAYSVRDALRQISDLKKNEDVPDLGEAPTNYLDPHYKSFLLEVDAALMSFRNRCPREEFTVRIDSWRRQTGYERARTPENDYKAVRVQVDQGAATIEEIAEEVYLSQVEIKTICGQIVEKESATYEWRPIGAASQLDNKHGSSSKGIFRKDAPYYESNGNVEHEDWD